MAEEPEITIHPGVAAVVLDSQRRILLQRRMYEQGWAPPSGHVEPGESVRAALVREIKEETNLDVSIERLVGVYSDPTFQVVDRPDGQRAHYVTCVFLCEIGGGVFRASDEGDAWGWFDATDLPRDLVGYGRVWLEDALGDTDLVQIR